MKKYLGMFPLEFDDDAGVEAALPTEIHLIPIGQWQHDLYGPITITASDIKEFVQNFNANVRKGVFITAGHEGFEELPAVAWVTKVYARDDGLWGTPEWNELGKETLGDKHYKYFSPEFYRDYEDPQTHDIYRNVLTGGALTKSPYFKELEALVASDKVLCFSDYPKQTFNDNDTMDLNDLLAKDKATLNDAEKAFIKEHAADLTDEQKASHADVIAETTDAAPTETDEAKAAREAAEAETAAGDANEAAGLNRDGSAKTPEQVQASEKVMVSAAELAILRSKADEGAAAFAELKAKKLADGVAALTFSARNPGGRFLPKEKDLLSTFMESLNDEQAKSFSTLVSLIPASQTFSELGDGGANDGTAGAEVEAKVDAKMKANDKLTYSEALKEVMAETKGLEERYDGELSPVGKQRGI